MRYGTTTILGRTNVGKSTFLNAALGLPLAIVSERPQTTRDSLLGVINLGDAQIGLVDTPGLHRPKTELGRCMNAVAVESARTTDAVVFMTDISERARVLGLSPEKALLPGNAGRDATDSDLDLLNLIPEGLPSISVINKVDRLRDKGQLLPFIQAMNERHAFTATVPTSARSGQGVEQVLKALAEHMPERPKVFEGDALTDRPLSFFAREYVREQVLILARREVPHAVAVTVDSFEERSSGMHIAATIHVEKPGQRSILVGHRGESIRQIGMRARQRLADLTGQPVHLTLFVRVTARWRNTTRQLAELGYRQTLPSAANLPPRHRGA